MIIDINGQYKQESVSDKVILDGANTSPMKADALDDVIILEEEQLLDVGQPTKIEGINFANLDAFLQQEDDDFY